MITFGMFGLLCVLGFMFFLLYVSVKDMSDQLLDLVDDSRFYLSTVIVTDDMVLEERKVGVRVMHALGSGGSATAIPSTLDRHINA